MHTNTHTQTQNNILYTIYIVSFVSLYIFLFVTIHFIVCIFSIVLFRREH